MKKKLFIIFISFCFSAILWISIALSSNYYATINVPLKLINFPKGYTTNSNIPTTTSIKIRGKGWDLFSFNLSSSNEYVVSVDSGKRNINLYNSLNENLWLSSGKEVVEIFPNQIRLQYERVLKKKVKIVPDYEIEFKPSYGLATPIKLSPDSVVISGPYTLIEEIDSVVTEPLRSKDIDTKIAQSIELKKNPKINYSIDEVQIDMDVQQIVDKDFIGIEVKILELPKNLDIILVPNKIDVGVRGGIDLIGKLQPEEINASINYKDFLIDTLDVMVPNITVPENVNIINIKPESLKFIIKKY
ncbi:MAG: YbbR-like domain-containing protein [Syntrophothermus sp.]